LARAFPGNSASIPWPRGALFMTACGFCTGCPKLSHRIVAIKLVAAAIICLDRILA